LQGENFQNASEFHGKQLRFWTQKKREMRPEMFYKACMEKTSKMRLNFTANSFVFRRINREISPITFFINLASGELAKCL